MKETPQPKDTKRQPAKGAVAGPEPHGSSAAGRGAATCRGTSLVELVLAVTILTLVATTALPRFMDLDRVRCRRAAQILAAYLRYGQAQAMQSGMGISLGFEGPGALRFFLRDEDGNPLPDPLTGQAGDDPAEAEGLPWNLAGDVDALESDIVDDTLWFLPELGVPAEGRNSPAPLAAVRIVRLTRGASQAKIFVSPDTGFVRIETDDSGS